MWPFCFAYVLIDLYDYCGVELIGVTNIEKLRDLFLLSFIKVSVASTTQHYRRENLRTSGATISTVYYYYSCNGKAFNQIGIRVANFHKSQSTRPNTTLDCTIIFYLHTYVCRFIHAYTANPSLSYSALEGAIKQDRPHLRVSRSLSRDKRTDRQ